MNNKKNIASGLPGFGTKGKQGDAGLNGLSVVFTDYNGDIDRKTLSDRIINNKSLISNLENKDANRPYVKGDIFVDINSNIYEILLQSNNTYKSLGYKYIPNSIFETTDYKNSFGIEKMTNVYLGDKKFLVDDIQSDMFSPNVYDSLAYNNKVGDYTKLNFTDKLTPNNLFLHEAYVSEANSGRIMSIVSRYVDNASLSYNEFRIGNAKIDRVSGVDKFTPSNTKMVIDTNRLVIPSETYVLGGDGLEHRVVSEREYDMGVFKNLKSNIISLEGLLVANSSVAKTSKSVAARNGGSLSNVNIVRCDYGALFNDYDNIKDKIRANLVLSKTQDNSVISLDTKNIYNIYDIQSGDLNIMISNVTSGAWNITLELIDMTNGWTRVSNTQPVINTNQRLNVNVRLVNSYSSDLTFELSAFTNLNVDCLNNALKTYVVKGGSATNITLPLIVPLEADGTFNTTRMNIKCTIPFNYTRISMQILDGDVLPLYSTLEARPNIMFNMGYNIEEEGFVYNKENCNLLGVVDTKYGSLVLNKPSNVSYDPSSSQENYNNNATLASSYGNPQTFVHERELVLKMYNKSPLSYTLPKKIYVLSSDSAREDITSSAIDSRFKEFVINADETVDIFGISSNSFTFKVGTSYKYVYVLIDNLVSEVVDGVKYSYDKTAIRNICKDIGISSYMIENPHYNNPTSSVETFYLTVGGREFSSGDMANPLKNGDKSNFGVYPNYIVNFNLSKTISLESVYLGFNLDTFYYKKVGNDRVINNTVYEMRGLKSIYAGSYNILDVNRGSNQLENTAPYAFFGLSKEVKFSLQPNITSYTAFFKTCNYNKIYNRLFEVVRDDTFRSLVGFNQDLVKPISALFDYDTRAKHIDDIKLSYLDTFENPSSDDIEDVVKSELTFAKSYKMIGNSPNYNSKMTSSEIDVSLKMAFYVDASLSNVRFEENYAPMNPSSGGEQFIRPSNVSLIPVMNYSYIVDGVKHTGRHVLASGPTLAETYTMYDVNMSMDVKKGIYINNFFSLNGQYDLHWNSLILHQTPKTKCLVNFDGRLDIGNPGKTKTNFEYTIDLERVIYQSYTLKRPRLASRSTVIAPMDSRWQLPDNNLDNQLPDIGFPDPDDNLGGGDLGGGGDSLSRFTELRSKGQYNNIVLVFDQMDVNVGYCGVNTNSNLANITNRFIDIGSVDTEFKATNV